MTPKFLFPLLAFLFLFNSCDKNEPEGDGLFPDPRLTKDSRIIGLLESATVRDTVSQGKVDTISGGDAVNQIPANLNCAGIVYPQTIEVLNQATQITEHVIIGNDREFYVFLENLDVEDLVGVSFPFSVGLSDGDVYTATNYQELEEVLGYFMETCLNGGIPSGEEDQGEDEDDRDEDEGENDRDDQDDDRDEDDNDDDD